MLPQLRELEKRFPREVAVIGIESGKFIAERETARIREAALRLGNRHPIVNDRQYRIWRSYAVRAWPTVVIVDPAGYVIGMHAGEFTSEQMEPVVERLIGAFDPEGLIDRTPRTHVIDEPAITPGVLRYPGKVTVDGSRMAIADSGHGRVLIGQLDPDNRRLRVERVVDGFESPQGVAFSGARLYVSDVERHDVRAVDLATGAVTVVAGTGVQARTTEDLRAGAISSPWDVAVGGDGRVYIAMAGIHQLWAFGPGAGSKAGVVAGRGPEDLEDGSAREALLAQPMGVAVAKDGRVAFVDAESSAVRWMDPKGHMVVTVVGTGLFDFGDKDGVGDEVRLQHAQGVAWHPSGRLLVADSYNDAIKWVEPDTRRVTTWVRGFAEPSGLACGDGVVFVADTNAHRIAVIDEATSSVSDLTIAIDV